MIETLILSIKNQKISILGWMSAFVGIIFIRFLFESISSPTQSGVIPSDSYSLIQIGLFFLSITIGTACIIGFFTKDYKNTPKVILFGLPIIWIAPIIDLLLSGGKGYVMAYVRDTHFDLIRDFFTFFGPNFINGATPGMRIEIGLILIGAGLYVFFTTRSKLRTFGAVISCYILGFIMGSLPGIIYTLANLHQSSSTVSEVLNYLAKIISRSNIYHNTLHEGTSFVPVTRLFELEFDKYMSQILFIISFLFTIFLFWKMNTEKFFAVIKNGRPERLNFYTASLVCGAGFAYINNLANPFVWTDLWGFACLIIAWVGLWMHAIHLNDVADIEIDKISNSDRPLIKKELTVEEMQMSGHIWLVVALLGSWVAGFYPFFMCLVYIACSFIYSCPPLRLRRFPVISSFLISVACLATILAGFFFVSVHKEIQAFPPFLALGILIIVTLAINFKDMKDIEGDKAEGIITLAVLFGKKAPIVIGLCMALSILLVPIFLSFYFLFVFAIPAALTGYWLIVRKPYEEKWIFVLRFAFLSCIALSYLLPYLFLRM